MRRHTTFAAAAATAAAITLAAACAPGNDLARARHENEKYRSLPIATANGYSLLRDAKGIACIDNPPIGGMGVHYVNGSLVGDSSVDPVHPELLVYEPGLHGRMTLVALEYVVFQAAWDAQHSTPPVLFGQQFELTPAGNRYGLPAFYELHVWAYKHNPLGMFDDWNPTVICPAA